MNIICLFYGKLSTHTYLCLVVYSQYPPFSQRRARLLKTENRRRGVVDIDVEESQTPEGEVEMDDDAAKSDV